MARVLLVLGVLVLASCATWAYRPVIIFHGILASAESMENLVSNIQKAHPGTPVYDIDGYDDLDSFTPMWKQVDGIQDKMLAIMNNYSQGVNLICFSQGGLVCRGVMEKNPQHNVKTFISLSSPQAGQFGDTVYLKYLFPNFTKEHIYEFFYTKMGQDLSIGNYWRDPHQTAKYEEFSAFLYPLNNKYKGGLSTLSKLVLVGGPDDGVITPWQSSQFAFYNESEIVEDMKKQPFYVTDSFGLRTLDEAGRIVSCEVSGVTHRKWHGDPKVFAQCIQPHLD